MNTFSDKIKMQHKLFAELSRMFGQEVPLYDGALLVNKACNQTVVALLSQLYPGFSLADDQLAKTSGERHGAIRIGKPEEYRWVAGLFACFGMEPHNFYDMTNVGAKSQPIIATAFRSSINPEHRVFTSLLMTDYFDAQTRQRIESLLAKREVFSARAKALITKNQTEGGLNETDANALIHECVTRIFKWTGRAHDHQLYVDLCNAGFKIAADIACFESHHLNHLTPNTLCMDLYTASMKFCLGEMDEPTFRTRSTQALQTLAAFADRDYMKLHFKHLSSREIDNVAAGTPNSDSARIAPEALNKLSDQHTARLQQPDLALSKLNHAGYKDFTEGPAGDTPILLRQDAYKALTEPVTFIAADGSEIKTVHTARFGEIEQRFYATTPAGRKLYDQCLAASELLPQKMPGVKRDSAEYLKAYANCFAPFPKTLRELLQKGLVHGKYTATEKGRAAKNDATKLSPDLWQLIDQGYVQYEGLRYEDFLPVSAAGIFASNLGQYGTESTAAEKPVYTQAQLENIMGKQIIDTAVLYRALEATTLRDTYENLGLWEKLPPTERTNLTTAIEAVRQ
jgi:uncharacterized glyoxalase superfamily metalloenzyme YdcJ